MKIYVLSISIGVKVLHEVPPIPQANYVNSHVSELLAYHVAGVYDIHDRSYCNNSDG